MQQQWSQPNDFPPVSKGNGSRLETRAGFTLLELFLAILCIAILCAMLLPAMRTTGGAARRTACSNNLRQLILAAHNYESAHGYLPAAMGFLHPEMPETHEGADRLSGLVLLLPYLDEGNLWEEISNPSTFDSIKYPPGPAPWNKKYPPWQQEIPLLHCPASGESSSGFGHTNYAFCIGDAARQIHQPTKLRGAFACGLTARFEDIADGASNTIAMGEIGTSRDRSVIGNYAIHQPTSILDDPSLCQKVVDASRTSHYSNAVELGSPSRGGCWADGAAGASLFNTILRPGSPSCAVGGSTAVDGIYSAGSPHHDGVNIAMLDGSVRYVSSSIDAGDPGKPTLTPAQLDKAVVASPYGIWGALGTAAGDESVVDWNW